MSDALTRDEVTTSHDIEDLIADYQDARGPQPNISYFAFTATPRNVTLESFGAKGADGLPQPFHLYSMRQAIKEEFILDVLQIEASKTVIGYEISFTRHFYQPQPLRTLQEIEADIRVVRGMMRS